MEKIKKSSVFYWLLTINEHQFGVINFFDKGNNELLKIIYMVSSLYFLVVS